MDFKERHPQIAYWPRSSFEDALNPAPFQHPGLGRIFEIRALDGTVFLSMPSWQLPDDEAITRFLIEAPRDCPTRAAFETGGISFDDYWDHKGWLVKLRCELVSENDYEACYITPSQIDLATRQKFRQFDGVSPYQYLLEGMEHFLKSAISKGEDVTERKKRIQDFYRKYGDKIAA